MEMPQKDELHILLLVLECINQPLSLWNGLYLE